MKLSFYPKLAASGISKNHKLYVPYILTCICMVMMYYVVSFLSVNEGVGSLHGGWYAQTILTFGCRVIGIFSLIFLFYTNSFLIRRRKKEFGLYNVLGMGKGNLAVILLWESIFVSLIAIAGGLLCGVIFSKAAELLMLRILGGEIIFTFSVSISRLLETSAIYAVLFTLIFLNGLRQVYATKTIDLMKSESFGEKPVRANWVLAILGAAILGGAYYIAVSIKDPVSAIVWFFIAVVMVIMATYFIFIAGSVVVCKLLQKNKGYYYKTNHFVSVSSMVFRMKRNGAGLASICILSTMVLVMLSSTMCLYAGTQDALKDRYPRDIGIAAGLSEDTDPSIINCAVGEVLEKYGAAAQDTTEYYYLTCSAFLDGDSVLFDDSSFVRNSGTYENVYQFYFVTIGDYNAVTGEQVSLSEGEALVKEYSDFYGYDSISVEGVGTYAVKPAAGDFPIQGGSQLSGVSAFLVCLPDYGDIEAVCAVQKERYGDYASDLRYYYGFDLDLDDAEQLSVQEDIMRTLDKLPGITSYSTSSLSSGKAEFYGMNGALFFLGILLGCVFVLGAVLIMYYKQITEGYEDEDRFDILQKVGMSASEIKKSINSQVLTVFFTPLVTAGVHVCFAFPMIYKLLQIFGIVNERLLMLTTAGGFGVFALFYVIIYVATSRSYYGIVIRRE